MQIVHILVCYVISDMSQFLVSLELGGRWCVEEVVLILSQTYE